MGCCGSTPTVPSEPPPETPAPNGTQRAVPVPVPFQPSSEVSPVLSSQSVSRTRSRTRSSPGSIHHSGMSAQDSNLRVRTKSAPRLPQSSNSSSSQNYRTSVTSPAAHKSDYTPSSPSRAIQATEYVHCLPTSILFLSVWFLGLDEAVSISTSRTSQF
jgi:hypothetical protein